jgi:hypothetical protein
MLAGIVPHPLPHGALSASSGHTRQPSSVSMTAPTSFLVLAYTPPDAGHTEEATEDRTLQARRAAERPELRVVSRGGEELAADALTVAGFQSWGCSDYSLAEVDPDDVGDTRAYVVLSPRDAVIVRPRDRKDHIAWLVERARYEEALGEIEMLELEEGAGAVDAAEIGQKYIEHLIGDGESRSLIDNTYHVLTISGEFTKAAKLCPKVCAQDTKRWEDWIFVFAEKRRLHVRLSFASPIT